MMEYAVNNQPSKSAEIAAEGKEEEDDVPLFVPLYTQMSQKYLNKICHEKFGRQLQNVETGEESTSDTEHNRTKQKKPLRTKGHRTKSYREKVCSPIHSLSAPRFMARRVHQRGSAMRRGGRWFLTEYDTGYTLFQFDLPIRGKNETFVSAKVTKKRRHLAELDTEMADESGVELAFPSQILTLPEPFRGSDHSVGGAKGDETFFYQLASGSRIQALHLRTGKRLSKLVYAAKDEMPKA
uniref:MBD domain-containing protein n=1 Tax=Globodera pallida TaxID=36090 RepID=A0A183C602_GLOPA